MNKKLLRMASVLLGSAALFAGQVFAESNSILISDATLESFVPTSETSASAPSDADFAAAAGFASTNNTKLVMVSSENSAAQPVEASAAAPSAAQPTMAQPTAAQPAAAQPAAVQPIAQPAQPAVQTPEMAEFEPAKPRMEIGGWLQTGTFGNEYGNDSTVENGDPLGGCKNYGWHVQQAWLFAERKAENDGCGFDWGFRADAMFGTDAGLMQSYQGGGFIDGDWSLSGDGYGFAIPQCYLELALNRWTVKLGKFNTIVGYEACEAPNTLFLSHSYLYNHEPATHTGALGELAWNDNISFFVGATTGNDSSFNNRFDDFGMLAGVNLQLTERLSFSYAMTWARVYSDPDREFYTLSWDWPTGADYVSRGDAADSEMLQTFLLEWEMTERLTYAWQCNYGSTSCDLGETPRTKCYEQFGMANYLIYQLNDCWTVGGRFEWFRQNDLAGSSRQHCYELAGVAKYQMCKNLAITGEIRYDKIFGNGDYEDYEMFGADGAENAQISYGVGILATF